jgi:hypothetical protein
MKRDTISGASHKAQMGSTSRATIRKVDHSTVIPTADMDVTHGETSKGVPIVQPYGFSYWPKEQEEDQQQSGGAGGSQGGGGGSSGGQEKQPEGKSAMGLTHYANGTRSDPSAQNLQDPRHHMMLEDEKDQKTGKSKEGEEKGGKAGDVALYRTNDKDKVQQLHLTDEGPRLTSVQTQKFALVEAEQDSQSGGSGSGSGSSGGQSSQSGGSKKSDGQRPIFKKESKTYIEQTAKKTTVKRGDGIHTVEDKKLSMKYKDDDISAQTTDKHVHIRYKDYRIFVDESGCWTTNPIQIKQDQDSSSAGASMMHATLSESELRWRDILNDPGRIEMAILLEKFSGATIDSWVDTNLTNFEQLKAAFKSLLKALART